jgi:uncharacterized protein (TIGR03435 family)
MKWGSRLGTERIVLRKPFSRSRPDPGASVITLMDDLGLKLVPAKGQVETLVIDHVERPSENWQRDGGSVY